MPNFEKRHYNYSEWAKARFSEVVTVSGPGTLIFLAGVGAEDDLLARRLGRGEKVSDADAERRQYLPQRRHGRADAIGLDHRDRRVGDVGAPGQFALGKPAAQSQSAQSRAEVVVTGRAVHAFSI